MSCSELLRRRQESMAKVIAPRPVGDASLLIQMRKYAACAGRPVGVRSDGSSVVPSSESALYAKAGCAVCASPKQETVTTPCCPPAPEAPKPLALRASMPCPCPGSYVTAPLAPPAPCCTGPGRSRTLLANDMPAGFIAPLPPASYKPPRAAGEADAPVTCSAPAMYESGYDPLYWDIVQVNADPGQNPCGTCHAT